MNHVESAVKAYISHAPQDATAHSVAERLNQGLLSFGAEIYTVLQILPSGALWNRDTVCRVMDKCTHFIVIVSAASVSCESVLREIELARQRRERDPAFVIVPILCGTVPHFPGRDFLESSNQTGCRNVVAERRMRSLARGQPVVNVRRGNVRFAGHSPRAPLDVAFVTPNLFVGGTEHWFLALAKYSDTTRIRWHVALTNPTSQEPAIVERIKRHAPIVAGRHAIRQLTRRMNVLVVWGIHRPRSWIGDFAGPVVVVAHGSGETTETWLRSAKRDASHFVAVSPVAARSFHVGDVHVIPNGVDPIRCRALAPREKTRAAWGLRQGEIAVGYIGRISVEKNCTAIADAVRVLERPYRAVFIGPTYDAIYAKRVSTAAPDGIFVPAIEQVGDALAALDVLVMVSPHEGGPLIVLEAMLGGVPVVATSVGLLPIIASQHGELFVRVPIKPEPEHVAGAVRKAVSPAWRSVLPKAAAVVSQHFTAQRMADDWTNYLLATSRTAAVVRRERQLMAP